MTKEEKHHLLELYASANGRILLKCVHCNNEEHVHKEVAHGIDAGLHGYVCPKCKHEMWLCQPSGEPVLSWNAHLETLFHNVLKVFERELRKAARRFLMEKVMRPEKRHLQYQCLANAFCVVTNVEPDQRQAFYDRILAEEQAAIDAFREMRE